MGRWGVLLGYRVFPVVVHRSLNYTSRPLPLTDVRRTSKTCTLCYWEVVCCFTCSVVIIDVYGVIYERVLLIMSKRVMWHCTIARINGHGGPTQSPTPHLQAFLCSLLDNRWSVYLVHNDWPIVPTACQWLSAIPLYWFGQSFPRPPQLAVILFL